MESVGEDILEHDVSDFHADELSYHLQVPEQASDSRLTMYAKAIQTLPQPPALWHAFQRACNQEASSTQLANIIKDDPVLSAAILRVANAPGLGVRTVITDIARAVSHLGILLVRTIVSRHSFSGHLSHAKDVYDIHQLWKHGMAVAAFAEIVADEIPDCSRADASILGLFHDIGKMSMNLIAQYRQPAKLDISKGHLIYEYESFACTHIDLGVLLAKHWELPEKIIQGMIYHHHPAHSDTNAIPESIRAEVLAVYIADLMAIHLGFAAGDSGVCMPHPSFSNLLSTEKFLDMMQSEKVAHEIKRIESVVF